MGRDDLPRTVTSRAPGVALPAELEGIPSKAANVVTLLSWMCGVCLFSFFYETLLPVTPYLQEIFPLARGQSTTPAIWMMTGVAMGTLVGGPVSDRMGRRNTILPFLLLAGAGSLVSFVFAESWSALVVGRFFAGLGAGASLVLCRVALREACNVSHQLLVSSYLSLAVAMTTGIGPLLGNWAFGAFGLRGILLLSLVASGLVLAIVFLGFKETRRTAGERRPVASLLAESNRLLRDTHFLHVTTVVTLAWVIFVLIGTSLPTLLQRRFELSRQECALATTAAYAAYFAGIRVSRRVLTRVGPYSQITGATSALVSLLGVATICAANDVVSARAFIAVVVCVYALLGSVLPLAQALVMRDEHSNFGLVASLFYFTELLCGAVVLSFFSNMHGDLLDKLIRACLVSAAVLVLFAFRLASLGRHQRSTRI